MSSIIINFAKFNKLNENLLFYDENLLFIKPCGVFGVFLHERDSSSVSRCILHIANLYGNQTHNRGWVLCVRCLTTGDAGGDVVVIKLNSIVYQNIV